MDERRLARELSTFGKGGAEVFGSGERVVGGGTFLARAVTEEEGGARRAICGDTPTLPGPDP